MPLSEFLRLAIEKLEASKKKACPDEPSSRAENDLGEMMGETGKIMMQGQFGGDTNNLPCNTRRVPDTRVRKVGIDESIFNDISPVMPSGDMDLSQDGEMVHLLNYPIDDSLQLDYFSELLPKVSGVTANGMSTKKSFVSEDKRNNYDQRQTISNEREALKVSSSEACTLSSWLPQQGQISDPSSGSNVSDMISNCASKHQDVVFGSLVQGTDMLNNFKNGKMENRNMGIATSNSSLLNVSHSRETTLLSSKSSLPNLNGKKKGSTATGRHPVKSKPIKGLKNKKKNIEDHFPSVVCSAIDSRLAKQDDALQNKSDNSTDGVTDNEKDVEPLVASSVVSDNTADGVSCEQAHNSKRKLYDMEESECPSDDIEAETESCDVQKATPTRGGNGLKRTRVAEVHNLSERRRRDRINEKMRALQELIPNCNKVDKASMLDEAIGYLKTLQLQTQIMSMGAGLHMPSMMFHAGFQHIYPTHIPHYLHRDVRTLMGMGYGGMGMPDMNGGTPTHPALFPLPPMQSGLFHSPVSGPSNLPRTTGSNLLACGHPSRGLPNIIPRVPFISLTGWPPISAAAPNLYCEDPIQNRNSQLMLNAEARRISLCQDRQDAVQENNQPRCASCCKALNSRVATDTNK